ncbi:histone methyltransferase set2 [Teratosphaeriaceae sp. CCFEE 6253]|nr:histone methyltransferase set2 [Teratosphaeriaceae sp. CCFEE 6253]
MECAADCGCGAACQNQRFLRKQFANVTVIKTEKKGYGLRADTDLKPDDFIFEYIGEVVGENVLRRRMQQYDEQGIKHFYFMSLTKGEFVDATKRGNLGHFCNHSKLLCRQDTAVAKKPRKKKAGENDEMYVNNVEPRGLDEEGVTKVMSSLMQCKEKWIAVNLLTRVQRADDEKVRNRVVRMHGYRILKTALSNFIEDVNLCLKILDVLTASRSSVLLGIHDLNNHEAEETVSSHSEVGSGGASASQPWK